MHYSCRIFLREIAIKKYSENNLPVIYSNATSSVGIGIHD